MKKESRVNKSRERENVSRGESKLSLFVGPFFMNSHISLINLQGSNQSILARIILVNMHNYTLILINCNFFKGIFL